jgi:hypothetical protein
VASAASTVEESRGMVTMLLDAGSMERLLMHENRDIRSGAAAAVAKLGLGGKDKEKADEGDVMGMLQAAADLLEDESGQFEASKSKKDSSLKNSFGTTSLERGVEMVTYLISQSQCKEEIAAGFKANPNSKNSVLDNLCWYKNILFYIARFLTFVFVFWGRDILLYNIICCFTLVFSNTICFLHFAARRKSDLKSTVKQLFKRKITNVKSH